MNTGAFGEGFPYTNFHDLNLDWIISEVKNLGHKVTEYKELLDSMGVSIEEFQEYIDNIDTEIQNKIEEEIPIAVEEAIESGLITAAVQNVKNRRFIFIGDSYAEGWTPDGNVTGFPIIIRDSLGLTTDSNFYNIYLGGAGFGYDEGVAKAFDTLLRTISESVTDKDSITDIVFAGGYNDLTKTKEDINSGISRCRNFIKLNYHNPSLRIWLFAIGYNAKDQQVRHHLYNRYNDCYAKSYFIYKKLTTAICYYPWWASDGYHPTSNAQGAIAKEIIGAIFGNSDLSTPIYEEFVSITGGNMVQQMTPNFIRSFLYLSNKKIVFDEPISIVGTGSVKLFEFQSNLPLTNEDANTMIQTVPGNVVIHKQTSPTYVNAPVEFLLLNESDNTWGLYIREYAINGAGTGYETITDATEIIIPDKTPQFIIPYNF